MIEDLAAEMQLQGERVEKQYEPKPLGFEMPEHLLTYGVERKRFLGPLLWTFLSRETQPKTSQ